MTALAQDHTASKSEDQDSNARQFNSRAFHVSAGNAREALNSQHTIITDSFFPSGTRSRMSGACGLLEGLQNISDQKK